MSRKNKSKPTPSIVDDILAHLRKINEFQRIPDRVSASFDEIFFQTPIEKKDKKPNICKLINLVGKINKCDGIEGSFDFAGKLNLLNIRIRVLEHTPDGYVANEYNYICRAALQIDIVDEGHNQVKKNLKMILRDGRAGRFKKPL